MGRLPPIENRNHPIITCGHQCTAYPLNTTVLPGSPSLPESHVLAKRHLGPTSPIPNSRLRRTPKGYWAKKIRGRLHYFGRWGKVVNSCMERLPDNGWEAAIELYKQQADDLHAGRTPRTNSTGLTVADLCNRFLTSKTQLLDSGEIVMRTFVGYKRTCANLVSVFGRDRLVDDLAADDFERLRSSFSKSRGPVTLGNEINRTRVIFKYGYDSGLIDKPVRRYGPQFKRPAKHVLRKHKATNGTKIFEADEIRKLLDAAPLQLRVMILLGVNAGLGNSDVGNLEFKHLDLET